MGPQVIVATLVPLAFFALVFGIFYIRNRENMALIEKGINPRQPGAARPRPFVNLKYGLLFIGCGLGLLVAYIIDFKVLRPDSLAAAQAIVRNQPHADTRHKIVLTGNALSVTPAKDAANDSTAIPKDTIATGMHVVVNGNGIQVEENGDEESDAIEIYRDSRRQDNPAIYFALIAIGGGLGLVLSYTIEKKYMLDKPKAA